MSDKWRDGWMNEWMDGLMIEWINECHNESVIAWTTINESQKWDEGRKKGREEGREGWRQACRQAKIVDGWIDWSLNDIAIKKCRESEQKKIELSKEKYHQPRVVRVWTLPKLRSLPPTGSSFANVETYHPRRWVWRLRIHCCIHSSKRGQPSSSASP